MLLFPYFCLSQVCFSKAVAVLLKLSWAISTLSKSHFYFISLHYYTCAFKVNPSTGGYPSMEGDPSTHQYIIYVCEKTGNYRGWVTFCEKLSPYNFLAFSYNACIFQYISIPSVHLYS